MQATGTTMARHWLGSALGAFAALAVARQAASADAGMRNIDFPGSYTTRPNAINDHGVVAGSYAQTAAPDEGHGFIRTKDGVFVSFDAPGGKGRTGAEAINASGSVTGIYADKSQHDHGFVRDADGTITTFDAPDASDILPFAINDRGAITGYAIGDDHHYHGFLRTSRGKLSSFDVPDADDTYAVAINRDGAITGDYDDSDGTHGFVRDPGGSYTTFDIPDVNDAAVAPAAINASGEIAGTWQSTDNYTFHGFVRTVDGTITTLSLGSNTYATAIDDSGAIAGYYDSQGFVLAPDGDITALNYPGANETFAVSIAATGAVTG
ncbi:MAG TPA: hypothetical protein VHX61_10475 [Rhizomicrobium sp.]|jgi:hypothetical protein|nr:hypothetical protein [Rhizomicrobium sp.]